MKCSALLIFLLLILTFSVFAQRFPLVTQIKQVVQFPAGIPHRVQSLAYDGKKLWFGIYQDDGHYATYNPQRNEWKYSDSKAQQQSIGQVAQPFGSAAGMFFVGNKLWLASAHGESFGYLNYQNWQVGKVFNLQIRPELPGSKALADIAFDGKNIWLVWHSFMYQLPPSEATLLIKIAPETGEILAKYPLPVLRQQDGTHGLTFDGAVLWHIKGKNLVAIDLDGKVIGQFVINELNRPSGITWDGKSFWIVEFDGKLWQLPVGK